MDVDDGHSNGVSRYLNLCSDYFRFNKDHPRSWDCCAQCLANGRGQTQRGRKLKGVELSGCREFYLL